MSDESTAALRAEVERLSRRVEQLNAENARRKGTVKQLCSALGVSTSSELEETVNSLRAAGGFKKLAGELDQLRTAAKPNEVQAQLEEARQHLRQYKHREGLKSLYQDKDLGLNPAVSVERLESILGYKAEADSFNAEAVKAQVAKLKDSDPYLFGAGQPAQSQPQNTNPIWGGRGVNGGQSVAGELTEQQLGDPVFMHDWARQAREGK